MNKNKDVIIEFYNLGNSIKVSAIDVDSGQEAIIVGSPKASKEDLKKLALRKLEYIMVKNNQDIS